MMGILVVLEIAQEWPAPSFSLSEYRKLRYISLAFLAASHKNDLTKPPRPLSFPPTCLCPFRCFDE